MTTNYTPHTLTPTEIANAREQFEAEMSTVASRAAKGNVMIPNGTPRNHGDEIANARAASQREAAENRKRLGLTRESVADALLAALEIANAREQHKPASPADLPHYAGLREGDMVESKRGLPAVLIIAAAIFVLMILGAWAVWADPIGRTAATVIQADGEWK